LILVSGIEADECLLHARSNQAQSSSLRLSEGDAARYISRRVLEERADLGRLKAGEEDGLPQVRSSVS
jgi:hypothetical protein